MPLLAAPLIIPFAQAAGFATGAAATVAGLDLLSKKVQSYIQNNPENAQKIFAMIMPGQGLASIFNKDEKRGIGDNNPPSPIEEEKPPQKEPPEDPDILPEIATELTLEKISSDVKFKQSKYANTTDVYYKGKKYAEIEKRTDVKKLGGLSDYYLKYPSGTFVDGEEVFTTEDAELGFNNAKDALTQGIYNDLKRKK